MRLYTMRIENRENTEARQCECLICPVPPPALAPRRRRHPAATGSAGGVLMDCGYKVLN
ncbi:MAG TPA: hypothetical protein IAA99_01315 [Candidatus Avibacteroides faecavium]|nr:hypothetical protein [Candidatus Avibacteroides faecavium]